MPSIEKAPITPATPNRGSTMVPGKSSQPVQHGGEKRVGARITFSSWIDGRYGTGQFVVAANISRFDFGRVFTFTPVEGSYQSTNSSSQATNRKMGWARRILSLSPDSVSIYEDSRQVIPSHNNSTQSEWQYRSDHCITSASSFHPRRVPV